jgi:ribosomal protein L37AE/L43A
MNGFGNWLRKVGYQLRIGLQRFMAGRYGTDKLNMAILCAGLVFSLLASLLPGAILKLSATLISYGLMFFAIFRTLSRNIYKRYEENRKFLLFFQKLKDKQHCYYNCPRCRQQVRVPKGKGKISITCPKCREKFIKKT